MNGVLAESERTALLHGERERERERERKREKEREKENMTTVVRRRWEGATVFGWCGRTQPQCSCVSALFHSLIKLNSPILNIATTSIYTTTPLPAKEYYSGKRKTAAFKLYQFTTRTH